MAFNLKEYILFRTEIKRELFNEEVDTNFKMVANPWVETRRYEKGNIVYHPVKLENATGDVPPTGEEKEEYLTWWRANKRTTLGVFDISQWDIIGGVGGFTNITIAGSNNFGRILANWDYPGATPWNPNFDGLLVSTGPTDLIKLAAGPGIALSWNDPDNGILITNTGALGEVNHGVNLGIGEGVYIGQTGGSPNNDLEFKGFTATNVGANPALTVSTVADDIQYSFDESQIVLSNISFGSPTLDELSDVAYVGLAKGDILLWSGTTWQNTPISAGIGGPLEIQDEGISIETVTSTINFTGAGVTAVAKGSGVVNVDIPVVVASVCASQGISINPITDCVEWGEEVGGAAAPLTSNREIEFDDNYMHFKSASGTGWDFWLAGSQNGSATGPLLNPDNISSLFHIDNNSVGNPNNEFVATGLLLTGDRVTYEYPKGLAELNLPSTIAHHAKFKAESIYEPTYFTTVEEDLAGYQGGYGATCGLLGRTRYDGYIRTTDGIESNPAAKGVSTLWKDIQVANGSPDMPSSGGGNYGLANLYSTASEAFNTAYSGLVQPWNQTIEELLKFLQLAYGYSGGVDLLNSILNNITTDGLLFGCDPDLEDMIVDLSSFNTWYDTLRDCLTVAEDDRQVALDGVNADIALNGCLCDGSDTGICLVLCQQKELLEFEITQIKDIIAQLSALNAYLIFQTDAGEWTLVATRTTGDIVFQSNTFLSSESGVPTDPVLYKLRGSAVQISSRWTYNINSGPYAGEDLAYDPEGHNNAAIFIGADSSDWGPTDNSPAGRCIDPTAMLDVSGNSSNDPTKYPFVRFRKLPIHPNSPAPNLYSDVDGYIWETDANVPDPLIIQDEGSNVETNTNLINFTGDGVTAKAGGTAGEVIVDIPGGGLWTETTGGNIYRNTDVGIGDFSVTEPSEALEVQGKIQVTGADAEFIGDLRGAVRFKAQAGEALSKGDVVYISGISGNTPVVSKADADDPTKMPAFGLAFDSAGLSTSVEIVTFGTLAGLDTSTPGWSLGDTLYVSTTPGQLTNTSPTGESSLIQNIGKVQRVDINGSIKVGGAGRSNATPNLNQGSIFIGNASDQSSTLAIGADTYVLTSNGTTASWQPPSGGGGGGALTPTAQNTNYTASAGDFVIVTTTVGNPDITITLPTPGSSGDIIGVKWGDANAPSTDTLVVECQAGDLIDNIDRTSGTGTPLPVPSVATYFEFITDGTNWWIK